MGVGGDHLTSPNAWSLKRSKLESLMQGTFYFIIVAMLRINKNTKSIHDFNCNI